MNSLNVHPTEGENQGQDYPSIISGNNQNKLRTDENWTDVNLNEDMQEKEREGKSMIIKMLIKILNI